MNRRTLKKQQKALIRRRDAQQMFLAPLPAPTIPSAPVSNSIPVASSLSKENQRLIGELSDLAGQINALFYRASLKMMIDGMNEARTDSPVK